MEPPYPNKLSLKILRFLNSGPKDIRVNASLCKKSYSFSNVLFDLVLSIYYDFVLKLRYSESNISHTFASTLPAIIWRNIL